MAGCYDTENQRVIDRIMCIAFREARDAGAMFIDRSWIANKLRRSVWWVIDNWNKKPEARMLEEKGPGRYSIETLRRNLEIVLLSLENRNELFEDLLCSYPSRLKAVREAHGRHTDF